MGEEVTDLCVVSDTVGDDGVDGLEVLPIFCHGFLVELV